MRFVRPLALGAALLVAACDREPTGPDTLPAPARPSHTLTEGYIVDTGPGGTSSIGASSLFSAGATNCSPQPDCANHFQYLGGKFTLTGEATVAAIEGWMSVGFGGSVAVKILSDNPGVPGTTLFASQTYNLASSPYGWVVFSNYNVVLQAGTYWVTFEPVANTGFNGGMAGGAASPLADYAFYADGNNRWVTYSAFGQNPGFGIRIAGTLTTPPDPPTEDPADMIAELRASLLGLSVARGTKNALDATLRTALNALAANDDATACGALDDFMKQVRAQRKKIDTATAEALIAEATDIRTAIGC